MMMMSQHSGVSSTLDAHQWINEQIKTMCDTQNSIQPDQRVLNLTAQLEGELRQLRFRMDTIIIDLQTDLPAVLQEFDDIVHQANNLHKHVDVVNDSTKNVNESTEHAVNSLAIVDSVKIRMENCVHILAEVCNWNTRMESLEPLFEAREFTKISLELCEMSKALNLFKELAEFETRLEQLQHQRERLKIVVSPHFVQALQERNINALPSLVNVLLDIGESDTIERLYLSARTHWIEAESQKFLLAIDGGVKCLPEFIGKFYGSVNDMLKSEELWTSMNVSQIDFQVVVLHTLKKLAHKTDSWLRDYTNTIKSPALPGIVVVYEAALATLMNLATKPTLTMIKLIARPFFPYHRRYEKLQKQVFQHVLDSNQLPDAEGNVDTMLQSIHQLLAHVATIINESLQTCMHFASGTAASSLVQGLDTFFGELTQRMFALLRKVRSLSGLDDDSSSVDDDAESLRPWANLSAAFRLLRCTHLLRSTVHSFDKRCLQTLSQVVVAPLTRASHEGVCNDDDDDDDVSATMSSCFLPRDATQFQFVMMLSEQRKHHSLNANVFLVRSQSSCVALIRAFRMFVFDALFYDIRCALSGYECWTKWNEVMNSDVCEDESMLFSVHPSDYITRIGDHLLSLVQHIELHINAHLIIINNDDDDDGIEDIQRDIHVMHWLNNIVDATLDMLLKCIHNIQALSDIGSRQLCGDIDYLLNVFGALGMPSNTSLVAIKTALTLKENEFTQLNFASINAHNVGVKIGVKRGFVLDNNVCKTSEG